MANITNKDLVEIIWDDSENKFKVGQHSSLIQSEFKPGQHLDKVIPIGPLVRADGVYTPTREVLDHARKYEAEKPNAYEIILAANDIQPLEYNPVINAYAFRLYQVSVRPKVESAPEFLDHIRSIRTESRSNDDLEIPDYD